MQKLLNHWFPAASPPGIAALTTSSFLPRRFAPEHGTRPDCARRLPAPQAGRSPAVLAGQRRD
jgi:hypothetical protein